MEPPRGASTPVSVFLPTVELQQFSCDSLHLQAGRLLDECAAHDLTSLIHPRRAADLQFVQRFSCEAGSANHHISHMWAHKLETCSNLFFSYIMEILLCLFCLQVVSHILFPEQKGSRPGSPPLGAAFLDVPLIQLCLTF